MLNVEIVNIDNFMLFANRYSAGKGMQSKQSYIKKSGTIEASKQSRISKRRKGIVRDFLAKAPQRPLEAITDRDVRNIWNKKRMAWLDAYFTQGGTLTEIFEELAEEWNAMNPSQKKAACETMAGKRSVAGCRTKRV